MKPPTARSLPAARARARARSRAGPDGILPDTAAFLSVRFLSVCNQTGTEQLETESSTAKRRNGSKTLALRNSCADVGVKAEWLEVPASVFQVSGGGKKTRLVCFAWCFSGGRSRPSQA